jgi:hypothetical protein
MPFEWFQAFCIFFSFFILFSVNIFGSATENIQRNWSLYRCTPIMLPVAGYFSPDGTTTVKNFSFCIQNIMLSFAPTITQPFQYLQSMSIDMMSSITTSNENTTDRTSDMRGSIANIIRNLYESMINIIIEFNIIVIKMIDTQGKLAGVMSVMMHTITTVQLTFESLWNGVPGQMIRFLTGIVK